MTASPDENLSLKVGFVPLYPDGCADGTTDIKYADVLWPCVAFDGKEDFLEDMVRLFELTGRDDEKTCRDAQNFISELKMPEGSSFKIVYLLIQGLQKPRMRVVAGATFGTFSGSRKAAIDNYLNCPGFKEAFKEATKLHFGPEFSPARLRFRETPFLGSNDTEPNTKPLWPCLLFDQHTELIKGLEKRNLLSHEESFELMVQFLDLVQEDNPFGPYVFYFGRDQVENWVNLYDDEELHDFEANVGSVLMDNNRDVPLHNAVLQAIAAVKRAEPLQIADVQPKEWSIATARADDQNIVAGFPTIGGGKRVDFRQMKCKKCVSRNAHHSHDQTCIHSKNYNPPSPELLAKLTEEQYKSLDDATKVRFKNLHKHFSFRVNKRKRNDPAISRKRSRASMPVTPPIKEEP